MNICLTTECNNHCPFCFQKELHGCNEQFSLANLKKVLHWSKESLLKYNEGISLLGGEPTCYPELLSALDLIYDELGEDFIVTLISNLLCDDLLLNELNKFNNLKFLINSCYDKDKEQIFFRNLSKLSNKHNICISVTLTENTNLNSTYISRLEHIFNTFKDLRVLRIGLCCPSYMDKWKTIYNYEKDIDNLLSHINTNQLNVIQFDCPINYCQISKKYYDNLISTYKSVNHLARTCRKPPLDILPNLSAKYCYSSSDRFKINNIFNFCSYKDLQNYMIELGYDNYVIHNNKCINCDLYKSRVCRPCHSIDEVLLGAIDEDCITD